MMLSVESIDGLDDITEAEMRRMAEDGDKLLSQFPPKRYRTIVADPPWEVGDEKPMPVDEWLEKWGA